MSTKQITPITKQITPILKTHGVQRAAIFGSFARGEQRPDSDLDLLVEFGQPVGGFKFFDIKTELETALNREVDMVTYQGLHPLLREKILSEKIEFYHA